MRRTLIEKLGPVLNSVQTRIPLAWISVVRAGRERHGFTGDRVLLAGLLSSPSGLGRGARLMVQDFRMRGVSVVPVDMTSTFGFDSDGLFPGAETLKAVVSQPLSDLLIHLNPPEFSLALWRLPVAQLRRATIIGYWAWELDRVPKFWRAAAKVCDEIWVPSQFVADALAATFPDNLTVRVVPHAVESDSALSHDVRRGRLVRAELGIDPDAFVAGTSWSMGSNFERKGARFAVAAFQRAFPQPDTKHALLLRCLDGEIYPPGIRMLRQMTEADPRIVVLGDKAPVGDIARFYDTIDVYLSLTRSEGYGLSIAEASQIGIPVLATAWGLAADLAARPLVIPVDYTLVGIVDPQHFYDRVHGAVWAEPDIADAARHLRELRATSLHA